MNLYIPILIFMLLGGMTYFLVRHYFPWPEKHRNIFFVATFGPMVLTQFVPIPSIGEYIVLAFFGGAIIGEFLRPKIQTMIDNMTKKLEGDKTLYKDPKKKRRSQSKSNTSKSKKRPEKKP